MKRIRDAGGQTTEVRRDMKADLIEKNDYYKKKAEQKSSQRVSLKEKR